MRVLLWLKDGASHIPGGHMVQMEETAAAVRKMGHEVVITDDIKAQPRDFDLVHTLGLSPSQLEVVRQSRRPVVVSTIWWPLSYTEGHLKGRLWRAQYRNFRRRAVTVWARTTGHTPRDRLITVKRLYRHAKVLLPNSRSEGLAVRRDLGVRTPQQVVPNGVDTAIFHADATKRRDDFVLIAGRIEPHKNQLGTIQALQTFDRPIVVVGPTHPDHQSYGEQCRRALRPRDRFLGRVSLETLVDLYQRAAVHVLNSWFETTGLVSLEAAACGCPVVTTNRGFAADYFGGLAAYCDPARPESIAPAIHLALDADVSQLEGRVSANFTWSAAAARTVTAYEFALGQRSAGDLTTELLVAP